MDYEHLARLYASLEETTLKLKKTLLIARFLEKHQDSDFLGDVILLLVGRVYPQWSEKELGVSTRLMIQAISKAYGVPVGTVEKEWVDTGDLGLAAQNLSTQKKQATLFTKKLTIKKVVENLRRVAELEGPRSQELKISYIVELLRSASPLEARYITRTVIGDLRVGVAEGTIRDAIYFAFFVNIHWIQALSTPGGLSPVDVLDVSSKRIVVTREARNWLEKKFPKTYARALENNTIETWTQKEIEVLSPWKKEAGVDIVITHEQEWASSKRSEVIGMIERAYHITNDYGEVGVLAAREGPRGLKSVRLEPLRPLKVMLYQKATGIQDAFERVGRPALIEYKYDGFRLQIHRDGEKIALFTRRLENVTPQFPDIVKSVRESVKSKRFILDSEAVAYDPKTGRFLPFQYVSQRIKRKYHIDQKTREVPILLNIFDVMLEGDRDTIDLPLRERHAILEKIVENTERVRIAEGIITGDEKKAEEFYKKALDKGNEGVMFKNLDAPYQPGSRVGFGVKVKPVMENLDLVIVGAERGEGKRAHWFSTFYLACRDDATGELLEIGKLGTGIKEKSSEGVSFAELTQMLEEIITEDQGKVVRVAPRIVVEVAYEEIQKSPKYSSGYALRFPRLVRIRDDKSPEEASPLSLVEQLYRLQRHRNETED